ncbi:MAG: recombinase RecA, partial [Vampirovibrionales bacterium]|nr:recombinase RecA [Vampirovibrionales bacterium]
MTTKTSEKSEKIDAAKLDKEAAMELEARKKSLGLAVEKIERDFGKGAIMRLGQRELVTLDAIATGALSLDIALGVGGLPRGRVVEIYGPESSGKTTLTLSLIAQTQKAGGIAAFIDAEHALDPEYAEKVGVNINELLISQPDTGEQGLEIAEQLTRSGAVDIIVIDSVAALVPKAEIEGDMGDSHVGLQARLMSQALRKLTAVVGKTRTVIIFINQLRQKIGVMYGNPETTTGGNALKFYASVRLDIRKIETLKKDNAEYGNRVKVKVVKNKVAPPFRIAEFDIVFGEGISSEGCLLDVAADMGIVQKAGTWFSYGDQKLGQGRERARDAMKENPAMMAEIEQAVRAKIAEQRAAARKQPMVETPENLTPPPG